MLQGSLSLKARGFLILFLAGQSSSWTTPLSHAKPLSRDATRTTFSQFSHAPSGRRSFQISSLKTELDEPMITIDIDTIDVPNSSNDDDHIESESSQQVGIQEILKEKLFLGIDPTPEVLSIMAIYFVEGALGLARLAQTFFLKDELHLGPAELSALTGLFTLPWTIKVS